MAESSLSAQALMELAASSSTGNSLLSHSLAGGLAAHNSASGQQHNQILQMAAVAKMVKGLTSSGPLGDGGPIISALNVAGGLSNQAGGGLAGLAGGPGSDGSGGGPSSVVLDYLLLRLAEYLEGGRGGRGESRRPPLGRLQEALDRDEGARRAEELLDYLRGEPPRARSEAADERRPAPADVAKAMGDVLREFFSGLEWLDGNAAQADDENRGDLGGWLRSVHRKLDELVKKLDADTTEEPCPCGGDYTTCTCGCE